MNAYFFVFFLFAPILIFSELCKNSLERDFYLEKEVCFSKSEDTLKPMLLPLMDKYRIPGISVAVLEDGQISKEFTYGLIQAEGKDAINMETMFSVGSISKVVNAILVLRLVKEGILDLDTDINQYLTQWKVPVNKFTKSNPVTLRKILSHTAGFSVHGFADYQPGEKLPTTLQILNGEVPAKNGKVEVISTVGSKFKYSGGGITVTQLIIEEVTGMDYHQAAEEYIFKPLGLLRTSYENPLPADFINVAKAHGSNGKPKALPRGYESMPEKAASGLWTTPSDLFKILSGIIESENSTDFLNPALVADMISPEKNSQYGLGPKTEKRNEELIVFHSGANDSYRAHWKIFWEDKSRYIVFTNGANGMDLIGELNPILDNLLEK